MINNMIDETYLTVKDVREYLRISQSAAYSLTHSKDFPVCRMGGTIRIPREPFLAWVNRHTHIPTYLNEYMNKMKEVG
jgi:excisionase family DNA binding protein